MSHSDIIKMVDYVNENLPLHSLWDGYWISRFKRNNLMISGSQDQIYYRNYDIVFKKVIFFNLPEQWRDTNFIGDDFLRLSTKEEFEIYHPKFDIMDRSVFAIDLYYNGFDTFEKHTFFVIAKKVYLFECVHPDGKPIWEYEDPLGKVGYQCKENRAIG